MIHRILMLATATGMITALGSHNHRLDVVGTTTNATYERALQLMPLIVRYEGRAGGGLRYAGQKGAHADNRGYAVWGSDAEANAALVRDLQAKLSRGMSEKQILAVWCEGGCSYAAKIQGGR
jgi:hypothetical protein